MSVKTKHDFYSNKKYKVELLDNFKGISDFKDKRIDILKEDLSKGNTIQQAYDEGQFILSKFHKNRVAIDINGFRTTEAFNENILEGFYE